MKYFSFISGWLGYLLVCQYSPPGNCVEDGKRHEPYEKNPALPIRKVNLLEIDKEDVLDRLLVYSADNFSLQASPAYINQLIQLHTGVRQKAMSQSDEKEIQLSQTIALSWNKSLAADAQKFVEQCKWDVPKSANEASSIAISFHPRQTITSDEMTIIFNNFFNKWSDNSKMYIFDSRGMLNETRDFFTVLLRDTTTFGCGLKICQSVKGLQKYSGLTLILICEYGLNKPASTLGLPPALTGNKPRPPIKIYLYYNPINNGFRVQAEGVVGLNATDLKNLLQANMQNFGNYKSNVTVFV